MNSPFFLPLAGVRPIPRRRIMEKVDEYMSRRDYPGVERLLRYWLGEAEAGRDDEGRLMVLGELIGHYRKTGEAGPGEAAIEQALRLIRSMGAEGTVNAATTYINAATALHSFGKYEQALELFRMAVPVYRDHPELPAQQLSGLYNNMGLTLAALERYDEAFEAYRLALEPLSAAGVGFPEQAMTCLNLANAVEARLGMEQGEAQIFSLLDEASRLLRRPDIPREGYYAYVCEKCAPTFEYYGYFLDAETFRRAAEEIYDRA